jgi:glutamate/tyrosine decarboxylase-like PLP-dependent enzyme
MPLAAQGISPEHVFEELTSAAAEDADWRAGRTWSLVYNAGEDVLAVARRAYDAFFSANALNPMAFPSLRRFETEILETAARLLHGGPDAAGNLTTGGTESILMALKTARDWARATRPQVGAPEVVLPVSAHPAFDKAAHYLGLRLVYVPVAADFRVDLNAVEAALSERTILVVGSAPSFPAGVIDDIPALARLAAARGILCHVDACVGGWFLPFLERIGEPVAPWDFRVEGVTSISADLHKYGYCARGASAIVYRERALRKFQFHVQTDWPGGLYGSPSMCGSRPGGPIAAAWAVLRYLGQDGYERLTRTTMDATRRLLDGVRALGLDVLGAPAMSVFAFSARDLDIYALCDAMDARGWKIDRQQLPPSAHLMVSPGHAPFVAPFLDELGASTRELRGGGPTPPGSAAMYGALAATPDRRQVGEFLLGFMDSLDRT